MPQESQYIQYIHSKTRPHPDPIYVGIGDDAAIIPVIDSPLCVTQDLLIDEVHFLADKMSPEEIASRAFLTNLSDLSAMGAKPQHCFLSLGLSPKQDFSWFTRFIDQLDRLLLANNAYLSGGDLTVSPKALVIDINLIGFSPHPLCIKGTMKSGMYLGVTGPLGGGKLGLHFLQQRSEISQYTSEVLSYTQPPNRNKLIQTLAPSIAGATDISDGLFAELNRLAKINSVGFHLVEEHIPLVSDFLGVYDDGLISACRDSDDYEILFWTEDADLFLNDDVFCIGTIHTNSKLLMVESKATHSQRDVSDIVGWDPFSGRTVF